jgi:RimJ/RimL family protein N-acetyltransferase
LFSQRKYLVGSEEFPQEFQADSNGHYHIFMLIEHQRSSQIIGFIYSYDPQFVDGHCYLAVFIDRDWRKRGYGAEATCLFLNYLFTYFSFRKVYADTYSYNSLIKSHINETMMHTTPM